MEDNVWYPLFIQKLDEGIPVYIYTLDGECIVATKLLYVDDYWIDIEDDEGDWHTVNLNCISYALEAKE